MTRLSRRMTYACRPHAPLTRGRSRAYARPARDRLLLGVRDGRGPESTVGLTHRILARLGGRPGIPGAGSLARGDGSAPPAPPRPVVEPPAAVAWWAEAVASGAGEPAPRAADMGPGAAAADGGDPCGPARLAVEDTSVLADRMSALASAAADRLREARRAYDEHADRRQRAAAAADPRVIRAAKDEAQGTFRRARYAADDRLALERAAAEWLREIDRINARTREAIRIVTREDAAEAPLLRDVERLGVEADGARIAAESAAEACRNARIALADCEESERLGASVPAPVAPAPAPGLVPASVVARAAPAIAPSPAAAPSATPVAAAADAAAAPSRLMADDDEAAEPPARPGAEPAIVPLLAGDRGLTRRLAAVLGAGDPTAESQWQIRLAALVDAVRDRAIDSAALSFPEVHPFWGPYTQVQCREIYAALAALGYRFDGQDGFADGRVPGQRELSLAVGYAGLDPMRIRIWPTEAEMPHLYQDVLVDGAGFLAGAAGDLTLGEMIDLLGRRAEELSELWNAWGRVRPLLLAPA